MSVKIEEKEIQAAINSKQNSSDNKQKTESMIPNRKTVNNETVVIDPKVLFKLRERLRNKIQKRLKSSINYNVTFMTANWKIESDHQLHQEFFKNEFYDSRPLIIRDGSDTLWVYALTSKGILELKKMEIPNTLKAQYTQLFAKILSTAKLADSSSDSDTEQSGDADKCFDHTNTFAIAENPEAEEGSTSNESSHSISPTPPSRSSVSSFTSLSSGGVDSDSEDQLTQSNGSTNVSPSPINDLEITANAVTARVETKTKLESKLSQEKQAEDFDYHCYNINGRGIPSFVYDHLSSLGVVCDPGDHFEHFPTKVSNSPIESRNAIAKMESFISSDAELDKFLQEFINIAQKFNNKDLESLGTSAETPLAIRFKQLYKNVQDKGFYGSRGGKINFWSGKLAMDVAQLQADEICSTKVPAFCLMWLLDETLADSPHHTTHAFICALSKIFASEARGQVNVYISSEKPNEGSGLKASNYFWSVELPTLQKRLLSGDVTGIHLHLYNTKKRRWESPVDINSEQADLIPVYRRKAYTPALDKLKPKLSKVFLKKMEHICEVGDKAIPFEGIDEDAQSEAKTKEIPLKNHIQLGKLKNFLKYWEFQTSKRALNRLLQQSTQNEPATAGTAGKKSNPIVQAEIAKHQKRYVLLQMETYRPNDCLRRIIANRNGDAPKSCSK